MDLITVLQTYAANYGNYIPVVIEDTDAWRDVSIELDDSSLVILSGIAPSADMIAKGYEWTCKICNHLNEEIEITGEVTCENCKVSSNVIDPQHAYGD